MRIVTTFIFTILTIVLLSCTSSSEPQFPERIFSSSWSMSATDLGRLRGAVNAIQLGDNIEHVVKTVGIPDADQSFKKNEQNRIFTYYVTRQRPNAPLESDKLVLIAFNSHDKVKAIYSNVDKISNRNWP